MHPRSLPLLSLAIAFGLASCASTTRHPSATAPSTAAAPAASSQSGTVADPQRIVEADLADLAARMQRGELTSEQLARAYLDRIAGIDDAGPRLNAVIEINPAALDEARRLDAERRAGSLRGPLHGIPVLLKDNINATPMVNSAGSLALASNRPKQDAPLVKALRDAGAVILGKTNLSEWANFRSTRSSSGWSGRGGQTRNPYVLDRSPCGSSSGTGAAIAASLATIGVGTETNGSILCPSAVNGLVGMKPTVGLVGRSGVIPISSTQDTAGPMARSVADAAALLGALAAAQDPEDRATSAAGAHRLPDYTAALDADALRGARIGVLRKTGLERQPEIRASFERALERMRAAGAVLVDVEIPTAGRWSAPSFTVLKYEFKDGLERYFREHDAPVKSLAELIEFNRQHAAEEMPFFGQELLEQSADLGDLESEEYRKAVAEAPRLAGPEGIDATLAKHDLVALVAPTTSPAWPIDPLNGDHFTGAGYSAAAVAGYPSLTVPMGDAHGLPIGLTFMGPKWTEARLLGLGYAFEQQTRARKAPGFLPTFELP